MSAFITIEGIEGAGKSTLRAKLAEWLKPQVDELVVTREPGATDLGKALREILLDDTRTNLDPLAELLLFFADRAQHLHEVIRPALERGATVLCDRYIHSTLAYQGFGRQLPLEELRRLTSFATGGLRPDLVLLLDLEAVEGLERAANRTRRASSSFDIESIEPGESSGDTWNRFEQQKLEFHQRVRDGFLQLAKDSNNKFTVLDANMSEEQVVDEACKAVQSVITNQK